MIIYRILEEIFRSWSHTAVLRALLDTQVGFTGNEVARVSGMQPRSALKALTALESLGIIYRRRGGRDHIFTLNREHVLVTHAILPLYEEERKFRNRIYSRLSRQLKKYTVSAVVFGSVARNEETSESDFDLCCIVQDGREKEKVRGVLHGAASDLNKEFGIKLSPIYFTVKEFKHNARSQVVKDIVNEGTVLIGSNPKVILHG